MFSKKYLEDLLKGTKLSTVRLGNVKYRVGDEVLVYCGGLVLGRARITGVKRKRFIDLTEEDAVMDGFPSLRDLLKALKQHYPNLKANTPLTVIRFEWIEKFDAPLSDTEYSWRYELPPIEVARLALEKLNSLSLDERIVLEALVEGGSVRAAARKLGGLSLRPLVRGVLRHAAEKLVEKGLLRYRV